jgi:uncharacterized membrane protein
MSDLNPSGLSDNTAGALAYLTIIPALVFLLIEPYKRSSFVRFHCWQSIFFFVGWALIDILVNLLESLVPAPLFLTLSLMQLVGLVLFVVWLIALINAANGKRIRLPIIGKLAEQQANR